LSFGFAVINCHLALPSLIVIWLCRH